MTADAAGVRRGWCCRRSQATARPSKSCSSQSRRRSAATSAPPEPPVVAPADACCDERAERLPELLSRVSPASRMVLVLHYLEEVPFPEVADVLGLPLGTTKSRLAYGLAALRREAGDLAG